MSVAPPMGEVLFYFPSYLCQDFLIYPEIKKGEIIQHLGGETLNYKMVAMDDSQPSYLGIP